jgi:hypothetical protein
VASQHPGVADRWLAGDITSEHVDAAARGVARLPDDRARAVIEGLTPVWGRVTPQAITAYCARARAIVDPRPDDAELAAAKAHEARFLSFSVLDDTVHLTGSLARLDGELLLGTIQATVEKLRAAGDGLTAGQRRADALVHLAAAAGAWVGWPAGPRDSGGASAVGAAPISITLTADLDGVGLDAVTEGGMHLGETDTRFVLCDAGIVPVLVEPTPAPAIDDSGGSHHARPGDTGTDPPRGRRSRLALLAAQALTAPQPVAVGRTQRVATSAQRRALAVRDRGCVMPGCDIPPQQCQIHHLTPWTEGGATDLPNLVSLCWAHHRQVDLGRWDLHPKAPGRTGTAASHGAPFTITLRPRRRWGERAPAG